MSFSTGSGEDENTGERTVTAGGFDLSDPVGSFIETVRRVVLEPAAFFRGVARSGDYASPLVFALICALVAGVLGGAVSLVIGGQGLGGFVGALILTPVLAAIGLFIGAGILHLLVHFIVGPSNSGFEATFRVSAYAYVTSLVNWIPFIGWLLGLYSIFLAVVGVREVHNTSTGKAALVVLIPVAVVVVLAIVVGIIAVLAGIAFSR